MGWKMPTDTGWTREQLLVAFDLYCRMPFGKMHSRNSEIIKYAGMIGRTPSALAMKLTNIASLDPAITSTGRKGLRGASTADRAMWNEMQADWEGFALAAQHTLATLGVADESEADEVEGTQAEAATDYTGADKVAQTRVRIGQGFFRRAVLSAYDTQCCITGLAVPSLLVASHILPWRDDAVNRLNPRNGLCLSMLHDRAFDIGIITIAEDMTVCVDKGQANEADDFFKSALLAYEGTAIRLPEKFRPDPEFLREHRRRFSAG
jgi:predicted restriction endonuclease